MVHAHCIRLDPLPTQPMNHGRWKSRPEFEVAIIRSSSLHAQEFWFIAHHYMIYLTLSFCWIHLTLRFHNSVMSLTRERIPCLKGVLVLKAIIKLDELIDLFFLWFLLLYGCFLQCILFLSFLKPWTSFCQEWPGHLRRWVSMMKMSISLQCWCRFAKSSGRLGQQPVEFSLPLKWQQPFEK